MSKASGTTRKLDGLGRITLPMEHRKEFNIQETDEIEMITNSDGTVTLVPKKLQCSLCKKIGHVKLVKVEDGYICPSCAKSAWDQVLGN